ncbi:MAG TPA: FAD:protein FMN transferase [Aquabacterium sp.]|nr:FAD:protein FMN transferase [Aquabacterium sp.]
MDRRTWLRCALGLAAATPAASASPALAWRERALLGFGTTLWLRAGHADGAVADRALDAAVALLRHIERQMSLFDPDSALQRLNRDGVLQAPDPHLVAVLRQAQVVAARSDGAFDVTVQPLWATWRQAQATGRRPTADELARAQALVGWRGLQVSDRAIRLARPGMALTLNGIAQGYAAEQARALLRRHGITAALLDCGEWAPMGHAPDGQPWRLGLASPRDSARLLRTLAADGRGIAVSTDATLRFRADDLDHHILDPHTGRSPPHLSAVVVAAADTTLADALTKVLFMGTADQALAQARQWGVDAVVVDKAGQLRATPGWG